jgi:hypothetical protein
MICDRTFLASFCYDFGIHDPYKDKAMMEGEKEWFVIFFFSFKIIL